MSKKQYRTNNLDEAVFLIMGGHKPVKIEKLAQFVSRFYFKESDPLEERRKMFFSTGSLINLHNWLAVRQSIKTSLGRLTPDEEVIPPITAGTAYFFLDNNAVVSALYGLKNPDHLSRLQTGNFYRTKAEALKRLLELTKQANTLKT